MYTDFGYMEEGKLGKAYDLRLMWRLWVFIRPYWRLMVFSLFFVLLMTSFDLLIPYLTKVVIDRYIVISAREVVMRDERNPQREQFLEPIRQRPRSRYRKREDSFSLPKLLRSMDKKELALLQKSGLLSENQYYLFASQGKEGDRLFERYPGLFEKSGSHWFIPTDRMKEV